MVIGIDEVGRGCWAGPLVACAVGLPDGVIIDGLKDSKKLSVKQREMLSKQIKEATSQIGVSWVEPGEVDELGLTEAVKVAMQRAIDQINIEDSEIIIDGNINYLRNLNNTKSVIKADDTVPAVSAASIVAKVARDEYMKQIAAEYPEYGFENHVGYGTRKHLEALKRFGVTVLHRKSYKPIKKLTMQDV